MTSRAAGRLRTHLELGRVSNLPTVWTDVLAALVLCGARFDAGLALVAALAFSAFYVGGMYLNDACDADIDARERPSRPIPSGRIERASVYAWSAAWGLAGIALVGTCRLSAPDVAGSGSIAWLFATAALVACIVAYDRHHKGNPCGPWMMAACRVGVYLACAFAFTGAPDASVYVGAAMVFAWIVGLTAFAKREGMASVTGTAAEPSPWAAWPLGALALPVIAACAALAATPALVFPMVALVAVTVLARRWMRNGMPGDFPRAVGMMIAAVALLDAGLIAWAGSLPLAALAAVGFPATLLLQRQVAGT